VVGALVYLNTQCGTSFFLLDKKGVHLLGQLCPICLLKVNMINDIFQLAPRRMDAVLCLLILSSATH